MSGVRGKEFDRWNGLKKELERERPNEPKTFFHEREIWWAALGENLGWEECGKNENFERPVVIIRKFNNDVFLAIPTTTTIREGKHYYNYKRDGEEYSAILSQIKMCDRARLLRKVGYMPKNHYLGLKLKFLRLVI